MEIVYLNGRFVPYDQAVVSVEDRGLLFADGIYEVVRVYGGRIFALEAHLDRLVKSAAAIRLPLPPRAEVEAALRESLARNGLDAAEATVYVQITRGAGPRSHTLPPEPHPTVFMIARPASPPPAELVAQGATAITVPDRRWHRCSIKSVGLLLNTLARQEAADAGAYEALFVRDGVVTEGSATNAFAVFGGELWTHPEGDHVLSGITRDTVLRAARELGIGVHQEPVLIDRFYRADEAFISGTNTEVLPLRSIDGRPVGTGRPGPVTERLRLAYRRAVGAD